MEDDAYESKLGGNADRRRKTRLSGQNVAPVPPCADPKRREDCRLDLRRFCETYFRDAFYLPWSPDHLRVIGKIEEAVLGGNLLAVAMPRGSGKTTLFRAAALWAILFGHRRWVVLVAATGPLAASMLANLKRKLTTSAELMADFPEACHPARLLKGSPLKANAQHHNGAQTFLEWTTRGIVFARVPETKCAEARITCIGIEGAIRGLLATVSTGEEIRPDLVLVDDPQTKASANSKSETNTRIEVVQGDILGLAGPTTRIAGLLACTVIRKGDLADTMLDTKQSPEWRGERTKMVYSFPKNEQLWEEYFQRRESDLHAGGTGDVATDFYRERQAEMDEGAHVAWPERHAPEFASAIEQAMFLRHRSPDVFFAEYQNEPVEQADADHQFPTVQDVMGKANGYPRGTYPQAASILTAFIDVQQNALFYVVVAWEKDFTGYVLDYGTYPKQHAIYFTYRNLRHTLADVFPNHGAEAGIVAGLKALTGELLTRNWEQAGGGTSRIGKCLIDSGDFTQTIYGFCHQCGYGTVFPSKGRGIKAGSVPFDEFAPRPGEKMGANWIEKGVDSHRSVRLTEYDTNAWKTALQLRLATNLGDAGCLSLFKGTPYDHRAIADHLTAEKAVKTEGRGRTVWEWKLPANRPDNHWLDCLVGAAVAASTLGVTLPGSIERVKGRRRLSLAEMAARANVPTAQQLRDRSMEGK